MQHQLRYLLGIGRSVLAPEVCRGRCPKRLRRDDQKGRRAERVRMEQEYVDFGSFSNVLHHFSGNEFFRLVLP